MVLIKNTTRLFFTIFIVLVCASSARAEKKSFIWEVKSPTTTVFIHGSIHFAKPEMYPLASAIENGFDQSSNLVVELNPLAVNQQRMQQLLLEKGMYTGNKTIKKDLTGEVFQMLANYLEKNNIPLEQVEKMRPGLLAITLSTIQIMKMGYLPQYGIDMYFSGKATREKKKILELETMEEQLNLLLDMPDENLYLKYTLQDLDKIEQLFNDIMKLWLSGDAPGMNAAILEPYEDDPELELILEELFFARNNRMTNRIRGFLETDQKYFVVVGAGHLVGDKGIISQLKKANYTVRQL